MKFATLPNGKPDGRLYVVSRDLAHAQPAIAVDTMQGLLENWDKFESSLQTQYDALNAGVDAAFDPALALAPLPRAWQWLDGSAYDSHGDLMQKVFKMDPIPKGRPLMYQGMSHEFLPATADVPFQSEADGIDFEGEFGIICDAVPMGTNAKTAKDHIRLLVQINDWSLRTIAPVEMKTGFGWVQAKPACSVAPVAVTPDELGEAWRDARVDLPLHVELNGASFGAAEGYHMSFGFDELVAHAARTRSLVAGTIIGSGTVSNENFREIGSSCLAERRGIEMLDTGTPQTPYMAFGDHVRMECRKRDGTPVFGEIAQQVVQAS